MNKVRLSRINDFEEFLKTAHITFNEFLDKDKRVKDFKEIYGLNIYPERETDNDYKKRSLNISWGIRKYDRIIVGNKLKALIENGATLFYERLDRGHVVVLLYPAHTENRMPIEKCIILKRRLDPKRLKDKRFLKDNWNDLVAYMESTSLDGNPSLLQQIRVYYLRTFKHLNIDNITRPTRFSNFLKETGKFVFSVGLSGFLIYFITYPYQNENAKIIKQQLDITNKLMNDLSIKLDTVADSQDKTLPIESDSID